MGAERTAADSAVVGAPGATPLPRDGFATEPLVAEEADVVGPARSSASGAVPAWGGALVVVGALGLFVLLRLGRLPRREAPPLPGGAAGMLVLAAAMVLLSSLGAAVALAVAASPPDGTPAVVRLAREQAIGMVGALVGQAPVVLVVFRGLRPPASRLRAQGSARASSGEPARPGALARIALGAATALVAMPLAIAVAALASGVRERLTGTPTDAIAHDTLKLIVEAPGGWARMLSLLAVVGAPVVEETLYRGLGHGILRAVGAGPWTTIVAVSLVFAAAHWTVAAGPAIAALFVLGIAFGWARERSGGLLAPIVAHALFNAANLWLAT